MSLNSHGIAKKIKDLRAEKGLTQKQLADATGLSYSSITSYENGLREPNGRAMAALERYFGVTGDYLRGGCRQVGPDRP